MIEFCWLLLLLLFLGIIMGWIGDCHINALRVKMLARNCLYLNEMETDSDSDLSGACIESEIEKKYKENGRLGTNLQRRWDRVYNFPDLTLNQDRFDVIGACYRHRICTQNVHRTTFNTCHSIVHWGECNALLAIRPDRTIRQFPEKKRRTH